MYYIFDGKIVKDTKLKNKVYFPKKYLRNILENKNYCKIIKKNILKIYYSYINNKINQGLIAINTINNL